MIENSQAKKKDPKRQELGRISRKNGQHFEAVIQKTFDYYRERGFADIEKTPEPMKVIKSIGRGQFIACFEKKAQPDYEGTVKGGRTVIFEAKFTTSDRVLQDRVIDVQSQYMDRKSALGARCFVICGFMSKQVYRVPWQDWKNMKNIFGHKYATEDDLEKYRVSKAWNGTLLIL